MLSANSQWGLNHIQSQTGNTKAQIVPSGHQFIPPKVFSGEHPSPHPPKLKLGKLSRTPLDHLESLLRDTSSLSASSQTQDAWCSLEEPRSILASGKALGSDERKGCTHSACSVSSGLSQGARMTHRVLPGSSTRKKAVSVVVFNPMGEAATWLISSGFSAIQNVQFPHFSETPSLHEGGPFAV